MVGQDIFDTLDSGGLQEIGTMRSREKIQEVTHCVCFDVQGPKRFNNASDQHDFKNNVKPLVATEVRLL